MGVVAVVGREDRRRARKIAGTNELRDWIAEASGDPPWLVEESYHHVGDLAETLTLLLDDPPPAERDDTPLHVWIEQRLLAVAGLDAATRHDVIVGAWRALAYDERLAFNKLLTGALRVGVSQRLVQQALAEMSGVDIARIAQRMLGAWSPSPAFLRDLLTEGELPGDRAQPYPFSSLRRWKLRPKRSDPSTTGCSSGNGMASACS